MRHSFFLKTLTIYWTQLDINGGEFLDVATFLDRNECPLNSTKMKLVGVLL